MLVGLTVLLRAWRQASWLEGKLLFGLQVSCLSIVEKW